MRGRLAFAGSQLRKDESVIYRELGKTGLKVSQLGFGAMRLPMVGEGKDARVNRALSTPMFHTAFQAGVNYVDTATMYCNDDSQRAVGDAIKGWRDKLVISTKNPNFGTSEKEWWTNLENSLQRLDVQYIDIYNHHGIGWQNYQDNIAPRLAGWMRKARDQKLIRHICCSYHDSCENLIKVLDQDYVESVTLQYNMLDRQMEPAIAHAHAKKVGIVVMGPVGGGRLGDSSQILEGLVPGIKRVPELALRFVLSNPNVTVALSGMSTLQQVQENCAAAADPISLSASDRQGIEEHLVRLKGMEKLYCTGCNYCMPCPSEVNIPSVFAKFNLMRVWGLNKVAKENYASIGKYDWEKGKDASACSECGACEDKCPQKLPIREQLKLAHEAMKK
jgi:predicted aldo/keto reductase-like oxidoreductase